MGTKMEGAGYWNIQELSFKDFLSHIHILAYALIIMRNISRWLLGPEKHGPPVGKENCCYNP
jgi:hypothetical protein